MSDETDSIMTDAEIYDSLIDLNFEFDEKRFISLTEIAESCGMSPLSYLRKAIRNQKSIFARLRGTGAIITGKKLGDYHKISLQFQLWDLSYDNLKKMNFNKPPWKITSLYRPDVIYGKPDVQFTYYEPEPIDENDLFLLMPTDETLNQTTDETEHRAIKKIGKRSNKELHRIFWRAFTSLRDESGFDPKSKEVWQIIYDELKAEDQFRGKKGTRPERTYDPRDHIEVIDSVNMPSPKLQWIIAATTDSRISEQGTYSLESLPALLSKLKKTPPKV